MEGVTADVVDDVAGVVDEVARIQPQRGLERQGAPVVVFHCPALARGFGLRRRSEMGRGWIRRLTAPARGFQKFSRCECSQSPFFFFLFLNILSFLVPFVEKKKEKEVVGHH